MKQCNHEIDGLRSGLSPSARPFPIDSSSYSLTASKSEHEDSIMGDSTFDLSFLSSDDSLSNLSRDVETTKEGQLLEGNVFLNPNPVFWNLPKLLIKSSKVTDDEKLELSCANTTVMSEKSSTDSEVDSPCWRGIHSHKTLGSGVKSLTSRRSTDDLSGFPRLNPLASQFIPSNSKKNLDTDGKICEENCSSSLKKSLSSTFPSSSGEFNIGDPLEDGISDAARRTSILTNNTGEKFGLVSEDSLSKTLSMSDSRNELQQSKRLDPLAPVFVPSSAKLSPYVDAKQGAFEINAHSTFALTSSDNKWLNKVKVAACSGDVDHSFKSRYGIHELGSTSSYNPWSEPEVGITEYAKIGSSNNKSHGQRRLNPLAPQFSLADTKPRAYGYEKNQAADDLSLVVNTAGLSPPTGFWDHYVGDRQSSVYVEHHLPSMSHGASSLISPEGDFGSTKWFAMEPKTTLSVKSNKDFKHPLPFHLVETAASSSSSDLKAFSGTSPKMDVKKLLTTMYGLSELLTLAHSSKSSDSPNAEELDLIYSTVRNLNLYIKNNIHEQAKDQSVAQHNSYDLQLLSNKSKASRRYRAIASCLVEFTKKYDIVLMVHRYLQPPTTNNMTVNLDVKEKKKYSTVSGDSRLCEYGATKDNSFGQVVAKSGYQQNHQGEEQINAHALFYKSLWLKAEAERCLMVYETSLSNPTS